MMSIASGFYGKKLREYSVFYHYLKILTNNYHFHLTKKNAFYTFAIWNKPVFSATPGISGGKR